MATTHTERETREVLALLGGRKVFPGKIRNVRDLQEVLRQGFPYAAFEAFLEVLDFRTTDLADLLGVASRTLARRKTSRQLSPIESDRLYRVAYITHMAADALGSLDKARVWLHKENRALNGDSPVSFLDTEIGERQVEELLHRINYGIVS